MLLENRKSKFERLVRAYSAELYRYAYWLCRDRFVAEDLVQEAFARAWQGWDSLREEGAAKGWLYTILRNEHARLYERSPPQIDERQPTEEIVDPGSARPFDELEMREVLKALPEGYREPLALQILGGFSCAEIGAMMNLTEGAVMTRLTRARLALRRIFSAGTGRKAAQR